MTHDMPFSEHLRDAIACNRARAPEWAALTMGRSRAVSRLLIGAEYATLPVAWVIDRQARAAGAVGRHALAACFVSMRNLPPVGTDEPADAPMALLAARAASSTAWRRAIAASRLADAPEAALAASQAMLHELADAPGTLCMRRHLGESAARIAAILRDRDLPLAVRQVLWGLLARHGLGVAAADRLDDLALPLQRDGVPILARDLPAIPLP